MAKLRPGMRRNACVIVMVRPGERAAIQEIAAQVGTPVSTLGRTAMLREVRRLKRQAQKEHVA